MKEIVIKIPDEEYEEIINSEDCGLHILTRAVAHGVILPKGYKIIDTACEHILDQNPCDTCGYEEGSIYCKDHCPYEAK